MLSATLPKGKWTVCHKFRCVMNTGWAAGEDKYKCRIGKDCNSCGADKNIVEKIDMEVKFISKEELDGIADALPTDFFNLSGAMQELEEKGITISAGEYE